MLTNYSNYNSTVTFDKHQTFYQEIYHQIDLIRKFKVTSELTTKEKVIIVAIFLGIKKIS